MSKKLVEYALTIFLLTCSVSLIMTMVSVKSILDEYKVILKDTREAQKKLLQSSQLFSTAGSVKTTESRPYTRSYNNEAQADLRNAATAQEAYYVDNRKYCTDLNKLLGTNYGLYLNDGVEIKILRADKKGYMMEAKHTRGDKTFTIQGPGGQIQDKTR